MRSATISKIEKNFIFGLITKYKDKKRLIKSKRLRIRSRSNISIGDNNKVKKRENHISSSSDDNSEKKLSFQAAVDKEPNERAEKKAAKRNNNNNYPHAENKSKRNKFNFDSNFSYCKKIFFNFIFIY